MPGASRKPKREKPPNAQRTVSSGSNPADSQTTSEAKRSQSDPKPESDLNCGTRSWSKMPKGGAEPEEVAPVGRHEMQFDTLPKAIKAMRDFEENRGRDRGRKSGQRRGEAKYLKKAKTSRIGVRGCDDVEQSPIQYKEQMQKQAEEPVRETEASAEDSENPAVPTLTNAAPADVLGDDAARTDGTVPSKATGKAVPGQNAQDAADYPKSEAEEKDLAEDAVALSVAATESGHAEESKTNTLSGPTKNQPKFMNSRGMEVRERTPTNRYQTSDKRVKRSTPDAKKLETSDKSETSLAEHSKKTKKRRSSSDDEDDSDDTSDATGEALVVTSSKNEASALTDEMKVEKAFQKLREGVLELGGPDLEKTGWRCEAPLCTVKRREESPGCAKHFDIYYFNFQGKKFRSRREVLRQLELPDAPANVIIEACLPVTPEAKYESATPDAKKQVPAEGQGQGMPRTRQGNAAAEQATKLQESEKNKKARREKPAASSAKKAISSDDRFSKEEKEEIDKTVLLSDRKEVRRRKQTEHYMVPDERERRKESSVENKKARSEAAPSQRRKPAASNEKKKTLVSSDHTHVVKEELQQILDEFPLLEYSRKAKTGIKFIYPHGGRFEAQYHIYNNRLLGQRAVSHSFSRETLRDIAEAFNEFLNKRGEDWEKFIKKQKEKEGMNRVADELGQRTVAQEPMLNSSGRKGRERKPTDHFIKIPDERKPTAKKTKPSDKNETLPFKAVRPNSKKTKKRRAASDDDSSDETLRETAKASNEVLLEQEAKRPRRPKAKRSKYDSEDYANDSDEFPDTDELEEDEKEEDEEYLMDEEVSPRDAPQANPAPKKRGRPSAKAKEAERLANLRQEEVQRRRKKTPVLERSWNDLITEHNRGVPVGWGYTKGCTLPLILSTRPPWTDTLEFADADATRPIAIQAYGGKMGWAHQATGDMMMNDFLGQHMVVTCGGCIAFSSDLFDWPALVQMCAYLQAGVTPPLKTYVWIKNSFEQLRSRRKLAPDCTGSVQDTITELVLELCDRQITPSEERTTNLSYDRLQHLETAARHLLECPGWRFEPSQTINKYVKEDGSEHAHSPKNWAIGAYHDFHKGARAQLQGGIESTWYQKPRLEASKYLEEAIEKLQSVLAEAKADADAGSSSASASTSKEYNKSVIGNIAERCDKAKGWMDIGPKRKFNKAREFEGYSDHLWWPATEAEATKFDKVAGDLSEIVAETPYRDESESNNIVNRKLWDGISDSEGGMMKVSHSELEDVWDAMKEWLHDEKVLSRKGGSQADLVKGLAEFQVLRMNDEKLATPIPHKEDKQFMTLKQVLTQDWRWAVAAVGLSAYDDGVESTTKLRDAILRHLKKMGFNTEEEDDVLAVAGVDVSGVGVRRPEIYIKLGQGRENPYWTLRHPEWGATRGYNTNLATWETGERILDVGCASDTGNDHVTQHTEHSFRAQAQDVNAPHEAEVGDDFQITEMEGPSARDSANRAPSTRTDEISDSSDEKDTWVSAAHGTAPADVPGGQSRQTVDGVEGWSADKAFIKCDDTLSWRPEDDTRMRTDDVKTGAATIVMGETPKQAGWECKNKEAAYRKAKGASEAEANQAGMDAAETGIAAAVQATAGAEKQEAAEAVRGVCRDSAPMVQQAPAFPQQQQPIARAYPESSASAVAAAQQHVRGVSLCKRRTGPSTV